LLVPVEEIETTETVEKTKSEKVFICDSCGLDSDSSGSEIYRFTNTNLKRNLYFCESCFKEDADATSIKNIGKIIPDIKENSKIDTVVVSSLNITVLILGYAWNGVAGVFIGAVLVFILFFVVGILYEILIE